MRHSVSTCVQFAREQSGPALMLLLQADSVSDRGASARTAWDGASVCGVERAAG